MDGARSLLGGGGSSSTSSNTTGGTDALSTVQGWPTSTLFLGFVLITLAWEFLTAFLAFVSVRNTGRKAIWMSRLKNEVLALGVITLVLSAVQTRLLSICIAGDAGESVETTCTQGNHNLYSYEMIHDVHYLLFFIACTHVIVTFVSFYLSLLRMRAWKQWESDARQGRLLDFGEESVVHLLGANKFHHALLAFALSFWPRSVTQQQYNLLRVLFRARVDNSLEMKGEERLPRNFNFLHIAQNCMEIEFAEAGVQSFVILIVMALYLLIPRGERGIYYLSLLGLVTLGIVSAKLHAAVSQLCGTTLKEFRTEVELARGHLSANKEGQLVHPSHLKMNASSKFMRGSLKLGSLKVAPTPTQDAPQPTSAVDLHRLQTRVAVSLLPKKESVEEGAGIAFYTNSNCKKLYWFGSPFFMGFLFQLGLMELSLALVLLMYGIILGGSSFLTGSDFALVIVCILVDTFVLTYASIKVQPLAAMVSTCGTLYPHRLVLSIKKMKIVSEEDYEEGIGGKLVMMCFGHEEDSDDEEMGEASHKHGKKGLGGHGPHMQFVMMLADQAGILGTAAGRSRSMQNIPALHLHLIDLWIERALAWRAVKGAAKNTTTVAMTVESFNDHLTEKEDAPTNILKCKLSALYEAFEEIDVSGDGLISRVELANLLKELGTRATREEVEDMILEIDGVGNEDTGVSFKEFCLFLAFKFLDFDNDGFVDRVDMQRSLQNLQRAGDGDSDVMIDYCLECMSDDEKNRTSLTRGVGGLQVPFNRVTLACFIRRFSDLILIDEKSGEEFKPSKVLNKQKSKGADAAIDRAKSVNTARSAASSLNITNPPS